jgi:hypothetical protein
MRTTEEALSTQPPPPTEPPPTAAPTVIPVTPTNTLEPTATLKPTTTQAVTPCNAAEFIEDVNYPDGTEVQVGSTIIKTWELKNVGTCTWNKDYKLIFDSGDQMDAPDEKKLTKKDVPPGSSVEVSVELTIPDEPDLYQGWFMLQSDVGTIFGIGTTANASFWVTIEAVEPSFVDLKLVSFYLDPEDPVKGDTVTVYITFKNRGTEEINDFEIGWESGSDGGDSYEKTWTISEIEAGEEKTRIYEYSYSNAGTFTTVAYIDSNNAIEESNEDNNQSSFEVTVKD